MYTDTFYAVLLENICTTLRSISLPYHTVSASLHIVQMAFSTYFKPLYKKSAELIIPSPLQMSEVSNSHSGRPIRAVSSVWQELPLPEIGSSSFYVRGCLKESVVFTSGAPVLFLHGGPRPLGVVLGKAPKCCYASVVGPGWVVGN